STGSSVTWTLSYGNTGSVDLLNSVLQDTLPPGFSYVSTSSSPSLGAPSVIPAAGGTIVRWNAGTIPANTTGGRTVTITARARPPTGGSGTPPQQTFTNHATLTGRDAGGTTFSTSARADVIVQALAITLDKSVDHTFLSSLPGEVTYTLTPRTSNGDLL